MFGFRRQLPPAPEPEPEILPEPEVPSPPAMLPDPAITLVPGAMLRRERDRSLNRLPDMSDWRVGAPMANILWDLREGCYIHRKSWEYALCIDGLQRLVAITPESRALAVGAGYERPLFYFANRIKEMVAIDLYDNPECEGKPEMLTEPWSFAPFDYRRDHLTVLRMSGDQLDFPDGAFDFLYSLSSIEHFGSRETIARSLAEMKRVLKPGGVACLMTELILQGSSHAEYFTYAELQAMFLSDPSFVLVGGALDLRLAEESLALAVCLDDPDNLSASPHLVLDDGERRWTSVSLFLRKV